MSITFNRDNLKGFIVKKDWDKIVPELKKAHQALEKKKGLFKKSLGWLHLPSQIPDSFLEELQKLAREIQDHSEALLTIGIGGSYLGIRAAMDFLTDDHKLPVYYTGHHLSSDDLYRVLENLKEKRVTVTVISKSGTTTEPVLAFRVVKQFLKERYSQQQLKGRIICITDQKRGALRQIAEKEGYRTFPIPDDVGGRFSVLTSAGLVPLAIAGVDIQGFIEGARKAESEYTVMDVDQNSAYQYAASRYLLYKKKKGIEVLSIFYPNLFYLGEWWKQLFAESEGKDGQGVFPSSLVFTTDLHSLGQFLQQGTRNIFETFLLIDKLQRPITIPRQEEDFDGFNCVADKDLDFVNKKAYEATAMAHFEGGVPNMTIQLCQADALHLGHLFYFFEKAVAVSGCLLGINPFDQPGVEAYKKKMLRLLGKS